MPELGEINRQKVCVCMDEYGLLSLQPRYAVELMIEDAEEFRGSLPYTVVGVVALPIIETPFLFIFKTDERSVIYDVIEAKDEETAKSKLLSKKRLQHKRVSIKRVVDLTNLVKEYK